MTAEVDICNLALSHLGDDATVTSISPPEGSAQSQHCAIFYPVARNAMLEAHDWGFATTRIKVAVRQKDYCGWRFVYAVPADVVRIISVKPELVCKDESTPSVPYQTERGTDGAMIVFCDHPDIVIRYTTLITDPNRFPPLFAITLSWYLASMLAGPILKGDAGAAQARQCLSMVQMYLGQAAASDANQNQTKERHTPEWMRERR